MMSSIGPALHRKAFLRSLKRQKESGTYMQGAAWRCSRKVSEACRPLCIINKKVELYEGPLIRDASADVCCKHVKHCSSEDGT